MMRMKAGNNPLSYFYYICDVNTDLPAYIADTAGEAMRFLGCSSRTFYKMLNSGHEYHGYTCFKLQDF